jgi:hypothetical protein
MKRTNSTQAAAGSAQPNTRARTGDDTAANNPSKAAASNGHARNNAVPAMHAAESTNATATNTQAPNNAAPTMHAADTNNPLPDYPLFGWDFDQELPDWDVFEQMLPHTPPVVRSHESQGDDTSCSVDDDDTSAESHSVENSSSTNNSLEACQPGGFKTESARKILAYVVAGSDTVVIRDIAIEAFGEALRICIENPKVIKLSVYPETSGYLQYLSPEHEVMLVDFFNNQRTIQKVEIKIFDYHGISSEVLAALMRNHAIRKLEICSNLRASSSAGIKWLRDSIKNTSLEILDITIFKTTIYSLQVVDDKSNILWRELIEGLAENSSIKQLKLGSYIPRDICQRLAATLAINNTLKELKIVIGTGDTDAADIGIVVEGMKTNHSIEALTICDISCEWPRLDAQVIKPLTANIGLKTLNIDRYRDSTLEAFAIRLELLQIHPTLVSINLGCIPEHIDAARNLIRQLKPNPRIQHIGCSWLEHVTDDMADDPADDPEPPPLLREFLEALNKFSNLSSITLEFMPVTDHLIDFLKTHPNISEINLPNAELINEATHQKILALVQEFTHIQEVSLQYTETSENRLAQLKQALHLNKKVARSLPAASVAMKTLLDKKADKDVALPFMPSDVTDELTQAIARHVPPAKATAIFDELILQAHALEESKTV